MGHDSVGDVRPTHFMQIGVDSFVATSLEQKAGGAPGDAGRVRELLKQIELADQVGLDVFGIGEHRRSDFLAAAPVVLLAAAAARSKRIRRASAVTVLSSDDPVRVLQQFATPDLVSQGRAGIIVSRGSFIESYPPFGLHLGDYDTLFAEKLGRRFTLREHTKVHWSGRHRAALTGRAFFPAPCRSHCRSGSASAGPRSRLSAPAHCACRCWSRSSADNRRNSAA